MLDKKNKNNLFEKNMECLLIKENTIKEMNTDELTPPPNSTQKVKDELAEFRELIEKTMSSSNEYGEIFYSPLTNTCLYTYKRTTYYTDRKPIFKRVVFYIVDAASNSVVESFNTDKMSPEELSRESIKEKEFKRYLEVLKQNDF